MKTSQNQAVRTGTADSGSDSGEDTLRVIANLPAPDGLVDRVQTRLRTAPHAGRVLAWPLAFAPGGWGYGSAMRGAAAAAIVCIVAGGCWRIYSHVQPGPSARIIVMPTTAGPARGFSIGGSVHMPDPARGPVLTHQVVAEPVGQQDGSRQGTGQARKQGKVRQTPPAKPLDSVPE
jgi:hypothetical protein